MRRNEKNQEETKRSEKKKEEMRKTRRKEKKLLNLVSVQMNVAYYVALDVQATQFSLCPNERSIYRYSGCPSNSIWLASK